MRYYEGNLITGSGNLPTNAGAEGIFNLTAQSSYMVADKWPYRTNQDPTADWVSFGRRFIASDIVEGDTDDYTGDYDVSDVQVPATFSGAARVYLAHKITSQRLGFYSDCAVACVQILSSASATSAEESWYWGNGSSDGWNSNRTEVQHPADGSGVQYSGIQLGWVLGYPESLSTSAARSYVNSISTTDNEDRWSLATGTGTGSTGAWGGIDTDFSSVNNVLPAPGNGVVTSYNSTNYIYRETSGGDRNSGVACRSPQYTFSGGEIIRIAHLLPGYSRDPMNPNDTLFVGVA